MDLGNVFVLISSLGGVWSVAAGPPGKVSSLLVQVLVKSSHSTNNLATEGPEESDFVPENYTLTLHQSVSSIWAEWQKSLTDQPSRAKKFELTWNGRTIPLNETTFEYRLQDLALCTDDLSQVDLALKEVTLAAFDDSGRPLMAPVTETLLATPVIGSRFALQSGNCWHDTWSNANYNETEEFCRKFLYGTMFIAYKDGDAETFVNDMNYLRSIDPTQDMYQYVGLRLVEGEWTWLSGLPQSDTAGYILPQTIDTQLECAYIGNYNEGSKLRLYESCLSGRFIGCHEIIP